MAKPKCAIILGGDVEILVHFKNIAAITRSGRHINIRSLYKDCGSIQFPTPEDAWDALYCLNRMMNGKVEAK